MKKRMLNLLFAVALTLSLAVPVQANGADAVQVANSLYKLGLFTGTGTNLDGTPVFDLERTPTRHEAVTMLVRLLGKDAEAKTGTWNIPFTDVADWAHPYVGYAYANGLTNGTGADTYSGGQPATVTQYLTFMLRALGYTSGMDFQFDDDSVWEFASGSVWLTEGIDRTATFTRGTAARISFNALTKTLKNSGGIQLVRNLYNEGAVSLEAVRSVGLVYGIVDVAAKLENGEYLRVGENAKLLTSYVPAEFVPSPEEKIQWTISANNPYATVSKDGVMTGISPGLAMIEAMDRDELVGLAFIPVKGQAPVRVENLSAKMDYVGGTTFTFDVTNKSDKAIKYITLRWNCLNAVGDVLQDTISWTDVFSVKLTGPLAPGATMKQMQNTRPFYNYDFANDIHFVEIIVDYMDGSVEVVDPRYYLGFWDAVE